MTLEQRRRKRLLKAAIQAVKERRRKYAHYPSAVIAGFTDWASNGAKHYDELGDAVALLESMMEEE